MKTCYVPPLFPSFVPSFPSTTYSRRWRTEEKKKKKQGWDELRKEKRALLQKEKRNKDRSVIDSYLTLQYVFSGTSKVRVKQSYRQGYCSLMF